ncbi:hypothetical protein OPKNFCMD_0544 [Methylobacterium crusticola]|uniref:YCII-related domain-containing protein n=1 Tax=Methylobacterium crusticola TaxID=1697972 RepID=A0ABQ4QRB0_9HYPH|nr:YciI family protein [Methylobacterium crusticola]GJD47832.1 hypothetical protein OPKNFCMD_0544 [Methylobacterium crusticola]
MKVMVLLKATRETEAGKMPGEALIGAMMRYNEDLAKAGVLVAAEGLHPSARGARIRFSGEDRTVVEGPFGDPSSLVAGFWIFEVGSLQEAVDWVRRCPNPMEGEAEVELRPILGADDFGEALTAELREREERLRAGEGRPAT